MNILAFDTSQNALSVAVESDQGVHAKHVIQARQQAQEILGFVDVLLTDAGLSLSSIDAIAVGQGPGSFTGLRLAASVAQGLAFSANLPVIPISSLQCMAQRAYAQYGHENIMTVIDARLQEVYWGHYRATPYGLMMPFGKEGVSAPTSIVSRFKQPWFGVGNGFALYASALPIPLLGVDTDCIPLAVSLLALARSYYAAGHWVKARDVSPVYLRNQVVIDSAS